MFSLKRVPLVGTLIAGEPKQSSRHMRASRVDPPWRSGIWLRSRHGREPPRFLMALPSPLFQSSSSAGSSAPRIACVMGSAWISWAPPATTSSPARITNAYSSGASALCEMGFAGRLGCPCHAGAHGRWSFRLVSARMSSLTAAAIPLGRGHDPGWAPLRFETTTDPTSSSCQSRRRLDLSSS